MHEHIVRLRHELRRGVGRHSQYRSIRVPLARGLRRRQARADARRHRATLLRRPNGAERPSVVGHPARGADGPQWCEFIALVELEGIEPSTSSTPKRSDPIRQYPPVSVRICLQGSPTAASSLAVRDYPPCFLRLASVWLHWRLRLTSRSTTSCISHIRRAIAWFGRPRYPVPLPLARAAPLL